MPPIRRYDRVWGIQIGKVDGKVKAEGAGVEYEVADDNTVSSTTT